MRLSTTNPPVGPVFRPAAVPSAVLGTFFVHTTAMSAGSSPAEVRTARTLPSPTKASRVTPQCIFTPASAQESSTGCTMSGSARSLRAHGRWSMTWVSIPRCASAVTISRPSGVASTTTATFTSSSTLSHSIARRMFFT